MAVKVDEVAWPLVPMVAVDVRFDVLAKVPEAPLAGAVKVTVAPVTGLLNWSTSWTTSGAPKAVPTVVFWGLPETIVRVSPVVLAVLVRAKFTVLVPGADAVTL